MKDDDRQLQESALRYAGLFLGSTKEPDRSRRRMMKHETVYVTPRKSWSPGRLTSEEIARYLRGEWTKEELKKIESLEREQKDVTTQ